MKKFIFLTLSFVVLFLSAVQAQTPVVFSSLKENSFMDDFMKLSASYKARAEARKAIPEMDEVFFNKIMTSTTLEKGSREEKFKETLENLNWNIKSFITAHFPKGFTQEAFEQKLAQYGLTRAECFAGCWTVHMLCLGNCGLQTCWFCDFQNTNCENGCPQVDDIASVRTVAPNNTTSVKVSTDPASSKMSPANR